MINGRSCPVQDEVCRGPREGHALDSCLGHLRCRGVLSDRTEEILQVCSPQDGEVPADTQGEEQDSHKCRIMKTIMLQQDNMSISLSKHSNIIECDNSLTT